MSKIRRLKVYVCVDCGGNDTVPGTEFCMNCSGDEWRRVEVVPATAYQGAVEALGVCVDRLVHGELPGNADWWEKAKPYLPSTTNRGQSDA